MYTFKYIPYKINFTMRAFFLLLIATLPLFLHAEDSFDDETIRRQIRMKTTNQLKNMLKELGITFKSSATKDSLQSLALETGAMEKWWALHPEKKPKKKSEEPEGGEMWEKLQRQMKGDFSNVKDPEKRRILEKLAARGMHMGGGKDQTLESLKEMEKMLDGLPDFTKSRRGGGDDL